MILLSDDRLTNRKEEAAMELLLWILAVILVVAGVIRLVHRDFLFGAVLIIVGLLVGPGGVSLFS